MASYIYQSLVSESSFGNPGSLHRLGTAAKKIEEDALQRICNVLSCKRDEFFFTSCGTESINTAIRGYLRGNPRAGKHILTSKTEHKAVLETLSQLERDGYEVTYLSVSREGTVPLDEFSSSIRKDTALISLTYVNSESGAILPVNDIVAAKNAIRRDARIHIDCVQALGKLPISLPDMGIDMASFSGHKIHCVKGIGGLYVKKGCRVSPLLLGGGQQNGIRSGTQSPWLYGAFALAAERMEEKREIAFRETVRRRDLLLSGLKAFDIQINSPESASPFIVNVSFPDFQSETMLHALESHDVYVSTVSACSSRKQKISYVLLEMGIPRDRASRAIRISFSPFSSEAEVVSFCETVSEVYRHFSLKRG